MGDRSKNKIVTYTVAHVASTLIANINAGLYEPDKPVTFIESDNILDKNYKFPDDQITFKSHPHGKNGIPTHDIDMIYRAIDIRKTEPIYFVYVNRVDHPIIEAQLDKLILLDYDKILYRSELYTKTNTQLSDVIDYVIGRYATLIPGIEITQSMIDNAIDRVNEMDRRTKEMKTQPFENVDKFYHIHGSHRGRLNGI